ncbi:UDP-glucose 4-epimerase GalE [Desulfonatronovibrio hydrogenovorans]|uniref:UDP-glucose 4-epimerase GalE n=1 Tax=Desulfonatronovibrio hydrogenovorans TaxID=53245 RepID=UPI0012371A53|nr:UDP-glucose 4-epimerase GalE [Desulfonatronovibrio hydrogenovorans]
MSKGKILVTGGAGYIGSHACKELAECGYLPVTLDNLVYGHKQAVKWGPLIRGDINEPQVLDFIFTSHQPEAVIHFAAYTYVGESVTDPAKYYRNNVAGTLTLLEAMRRHSCQRIIFSSTCATYGQPLKTPLTESHPQNPINPYGWGKLMIEQILNDFDRAYEIKNISLRYFNAAGADPQGLIGEDHHPETHLIPLAIMTAMKLKKELSIFGQDYQTPDGTAIRDYIHVTDLARAHILALEYLTKHGQSDCFNLGTGHGHSVQQVVETVERVSRVKVPVRAAARRPGDPPVLVASSRKAEDCLGWKPEFNELETIVKTAWEWHKTHSNPDYGP